MPRIALIGAGFIGGVHAANLAAHPDVDFALVHDIDVARTESIAAKHHCRAAAHLAEAFDPAVVDAVLIASSTDAHADHLRLAASAGLPMLCEKPVDLDLARATDVVGYVHERGVTAMVDFNRRFDRDYAELQRVVAAGEVGDVYLIQMTTRGPAMPPLSYVAVSGGQMRDQTVHFFDLARWISGLDPVAVFATGSTLVEPRLAEYGDVDLSAVTLRLPGGALVQIDSARQIGYGYDERIEVLGSTGMVEARRHRRGAVVRYGAGHDVGDGMHAGWFERVAPTYRAALDHFVDALRDGGPVGPDLGEALKAQAVAEAASRSLASGEMERVHYPSPRATPVDV
ncbi:Gfo/Idh/MocA family oxidoreductase [Mycobacterium yunnanensis]|uniref:Gfo/Idh/MocA family oxidoreductase n=1 Tax=Mycobacterium yunnanensis TaxID=368477 RepID=A0A9X2Z8Q1_9MYCO|nr:Gfo/Idh/MocA family oxidoreductase [Mycobacterium yunnanensis]MCV7424164.1 Gfo/Idh/MocA family oxidoreductase [Mycobacterium yunnanensis]